MRRRSKPIQAEVIFPLDDSGPGPDRRQPERTCIVTRTVRPPADLIRFVLEPDGAVVPDLRRRLPGRGVWVGATREAVAEAVRRKLFARAFKQPAAAPATLADDIAAALRQDLRQALSLANKAGNVVSGFTKVEAEISGGAAVALLHAVESAPDGRRKLAAALRRRLGETISSFPIVEDLSGDEMDLALGRSHVIHAALVAGAGSDGFLMRWRRLRSYCGADAIDTTSPERRGTPHDDEPAGSERNE